MMMKPLLVFCVFISTYKTVLTAKSVPVIVWKEEVVNRNPWSIIEDWEGEDDIDTQQFANDILPKYLGNEEKILVFVQDSISIEDFSLYSDMDSPYRYLKDRLDTQENLYFPGVIMPLEALSMFDAEYKVERELADNKADIINHFKKPGKVIVYVQLPKTGINEYRTKSLRNNDELMDSITRGVSDEVDSLAVIFTSDDSQPEPHNSFSGRRLLAIEDATPEQKDDAVVSHQSDCVIAYMKNVSVTVAGTETALPQATQITDECANETSTNLVITWNKVSNLDSVKLTIDFKGSAKSDWQVASMKLQVNDQGGAGNTYKSSKLHAPKDFSYYCTGPNSFKFQSKENDSHVLQIHKLQLQPLFGEKADGFGRAYDCVGFFTVPILSGIMISLLFAAILYWALSMVMGIQTMDQFDDPKGATISVPQSE